MTSKKFRIETMSEHADSVWSVAVLPDGRIVSGSRDKTVRVWRQDHVEKKPL